MKTGLPLRFAIAELRHERLFATGVVLAVCSVLTPILLLWGIKNGMITSLRERLMKDPRTRELRPIESVDIQAAWISTLKDSPLSAFAIPSVRQINLYGRVRTSPNAQWTEVEEIFPSAAGDPVSDLPQMDWSAGELPVPGMISESLAEALGVIVGAEIRLEQTRSAEGKISKVEMPVRILAIVSGTNSPTKALYLPVYAVECIEDYKDGRSVPKFGWPAIAEDPVARFDGLLVRDAKTAHPNDLKINLQRIFPESTVDVMDIDQIQSVVGVPTDSNAKGVAFCVRYDEPRIDLKSILKLKSIGTDISCQVIPFLKPSEAIVTRVGESKGQTITVRTRSNAWFQLDQVASAFSTPPPTSVRRPELEFRLVIPATYESKLILALETFPELVMDVEPVIAGVIGAALTRQILFNQIKGELRAPRKSYAGFRLYAQTLDDVRPLRKLAEEAGIKVRTQEDRISEVKNLDSALSKLFFLVAGMGTLGGLGALSASLYLSVERGKRQHCVMKVLGASGLCIGTSIILQAGLLVAAGSVMACGFYWVGAGMLQHIFADAIAPGESFCRLSGTQVGLLMIGVSFVGASVGAFASLRISGLDAAAVARSE
jgi:putative ABC transport system permease protein